MKRYRWSITVYFMLFVFVLFALFNEYSPILIVMGAVAACLIVFTIQFYYPAVLEKRVDRVESFYAAQKVIQPFIFSMFLRTGLRIKRERLWSS